MKYNEAIVKQFNEAKIADYTMTATFLCTKINRPDGFNPKEYLDEAESKFFAKHIGEMPARRIAYEGIEDYGRYYIRRVEWHVNIHTPMVRL